MTRGILIAGNESALLSALEAEAARRVQSYAAAPIPNRLDGAGGENPAPPPADKRISISWNPGSPISTRSLILAAENRLGRIDEAILLCAPPAIQGPAASLSLTGIEAMVNDHLKGWFFLVRELSILFKTRGAGTLALLIREPAASPARNAPPDLPGSAVSAAFRAFAQGLLAASFDEPYQTLGFICPEPGETAPLAAFVFKTMEESGGRNSGKWHKFGKLGLFGI
jgi:NAD(P)-dependent dehydrogenase (short-subunit alcohol dehydrogenase family)